MLKLPKNDDYLKTVFYILKYNSKKTVLFCLKVVVTEHELELFCQHLFVNFLYMYVAKYYIFKKLLIYYYSDVQQRIQLK